MPTRTRAGASARKGAPRKRAPRIKAPPPPREADPFAKKTGRRRSYYTPEFLAEAKRRIETTLQSTTSIATDLGVHNSILWRLVDRYGWVRPEGSLRLRGLSPVMRLAAEAEELSASAHSRERGNPVSDTQALEPAALGPRFRGDERAEIISPDTSTIDRLEAAVLKELSVVEKMRASLGAEPLRPMDAERTARTLSMLTETLSKLRRLRLGAQQPGHTEDDDILDIDAFRLDLARRIEAFVASQPDDECPDGNRDAAVAAP